MKTVFVIFAAVLVTYDAAKLPANVPRCKLADTTCLGDAIEKSIKIMKAGNQKIHLLPIDPLHVNEINIDTGSGNFKLILNLSDGDINGLSNAENVKVEALSADKLHWKATAFIKKVEVAGHYVIDGQVLILPVKGDGTASLIMHDMEIELIIKEQDARVEKNGKQYIKLEQFDVKFTPKRVKMHFNNLFNGDKTLGDTFNTFVNENWQDVFREVKPALEQGLGAIFLEMTNRVCERVQVEDLFL